MNVCIIIIITPFYLESKEPLSRSTWNPRNRRPPFNLERDNMFDKVVTFQGTAGVNEMHG